MKKSTNRQWFSHAARFFCALSSLPFTRFVNTRPDCHTIVWAGCVPTYPLLIYLIEYSNLLSSNLLSINYLLTCSLLTCSLLTGLYSSIVFSPSAYSGCRRRVRTCNARVRFIGVDARLPFWAQCSPGSCSSSFSCARSSSSRPHSSHSSTPGTAALLSSLPAFFTCILYYFLVISSFLFLLFIYFHLHN